MNPPRLVSIESTGPACPHRSQETTARVDVAAGWVRATVTDRPDGLVTWPDLARRARISA